MGVAVVIIIVVGLVAFALMFNGLVHKRNMVENAFSSIDVMLKKRYDLIPNLVATVKGYTAHESTVLREVTELRGKAMSAATSTDETVHLNNLIGKALLQVWAVVEAYPELKASEHYLQLQRALNEIEEQVSAARRAYNAAVMDMNNAVQMLPSSIVASITGFGPRHFFEAAEGDRQVPEVADHLDSA